MLLGRGDRSGAGAALQDVPSSPRDLLFEASSCLHALGAIEIGDRQRMRQLYTELLPAVGQLADAGSGLLTLGPYRHLPGPPRRRPRRTSRAGVHRDQAREVAVRAAPAGSPR